MCGYILYKYTHTLARPLALIVCAVVDLDMVRYISLLFFIEVIFTQVATIAVMDFDGNNVSESETSILTDRLRNELFNSGRYNVLERGMMDDILIEQGFQQTGCTSSDCAVEVGNMLGVQQMVGGSIGKIGNMYTVSARIIDVETGQLLKSANYDYIGNIEQLVTKGMKEVVAKLLGEYDIDNTEKTIASENITPELINKSNSTQLGNSYIFSFAHLPGSTVFLLSKFLDNRSGIGIGYDGFVWEGKAIRSDFNYPSFGDTLKFTVHSITTNYLYYLRKNKSSLFNPSMIMSVGINFVNLENLTKQLSDNISYIGGNLGLVNRVQASRRFGLTFGILINFAKWIDFNENKELYGVKNIYNIRPVLTLDITIPSKF